MSKAINRTSSFLLIAGIAIFWLKGVGELSLILIIASMVITSIQLLGLLKKTIFKIALLIFIVLQIILFFVVKHQLQL